MKRVIILIFFWNCYHQLLAQIPLISGPWAGNVELRNATIWAQVAPQVKKVSLQYATENSINYKSVEIKGETGNEFNVIKIELNGLEINTVYRYDLIIDGKKMPASKNQRFKTKDLWQYRKPAPDFNFLAGSCAYFNEPKYDRPGKPYGLDSTIFKTMAIAPAHFMLWMGDAWYTREVDFSTTWGLQKRVAQERRLPLLNNFMATMPQYFIWDDHDFGPNDAGKSFHLKKESRDVFKKYTLNPSYGEDEKGIYTKLSYSDVDLFLTDGRYFRSEDRLLDSIDSKPNSQKTFFGNIQMDWLKNSLVYSNATFKIIVSGSQVLNTATTAECMCNYSYEYNDLLQFITDQKIQGVLFFSGDRHHSEIIEMKRPGTYSLYDVTISPLTASVGTLRGAELNNPLRVKNTLVEAQNFGNISVSGPKNNRQLKVEFIGLKGNKLSEWEINEQELK